MVLPPPSLVGFIQPGFCYLFLLSWTGMELPHCLWQPCSWHGYGDSTPSETSIADAYHLDERKCTEADYHMSRLDQPVHGTHKQAGLCESKDGENECIHDAAHSQQAHASGEQLYETQNEKQDGEGDAQRHMCEDEAGAIGQ